MTDFERTYFRMTDEELIRLAQELDSLTEDARKALAKALNSRGLGELEIRAYQRELDEAKTAEERNRIEEATYKRKQRWAAVRALAVFLAAGALCMLAIIYTFADVLSPQAAEVLGEICVKVALAGWFAYLAVRGLFRKKAS